MMDTLYQTDVIVIGAGPVGLELAVALKLAGIDYLHLEAGQIGHTISRWPRNTRFFSSPERIGIAGVPLQTIDQEHATGEFTWRTCAVLPCSLG
jgi:thioredoxin reductase (NADPH)